MDGCLRSEAERKLRDYPAGPWRVAVLKPVKREALSKPKQNLTRHPKQRPYLPGCIRVIREWRFTSCIVSLRGLDDEQPESHGLHNRKRYSGPVDRIQLN